VWVLAAYLSVGIAGSAAVVFERTSPYHHVRVIDQDGVRILSFDGSAESRMSLRNPLRGHFEYTEHFHMPWLWVTNIGKVLILGLGGASTQRSYAHYYPRVIVESVEIDPVVFQVATQYFGFKESPTQKVQLADGRVFLRRTEGIYDVILVDAYVKNRYGSFIPYHLATREFFELANRRLTTNGVVAYNVIGTLDGWRADVLGSVYRTMKEVFPQVYLFPCGESLNVVVIGTRSARPMTLAMLQQRATTMGHWGQLRLPTFRARLQAFRSDPPSNYQRCRVLTDDFAPTDGLLTRGLP
jgi:spermidine synthase